MPNNRISKDRRALVLSALCKGVSLNAASQMFRVGDHNIRRVIRETGDALGDYMDSEFRDLSCSRIEFDEQWPYVGCHAGRMANRKDPARGDFWLWACIDADKKL